MTDVYTYKDGTTKETVKLLPNDLPFIRDFAKKIGVNTDTLYEWANKKEEDGALVYPEFSEALKAVKQLQEKIIVINALNGCYNSTFAIFTAKNVLGWRDKTETDITSGGDKLGVIILPPKNADQMETPAETGDSPSQN